MVIVLTGSERRKNPDYFDQHFRLRHEVFVRRRGWALPCTNGREIDQYDTDEAVYFLDLNEDNVVRGSIRIAPSVTCSLLADYFPHLVETGGPLRSPDIYECTRYIVMPDRHRDPDPCELSRADPADHSARPVASLWGRAADAGRR